MQVHRNHHVQGHGCGCNGPDVAARTQLTENRFHRKNWKMTISNDECKPVYVTVATGEKVGCEKDFDTYARDVRVDPGCSSSIEIPAGGNGICEGQPYRMTVRNDCNAVLGVVQGKFQDC